MGTRVALALALLAGACNQDLDHFEGGKPPPPGPIGGRDGGAADAYQQGDGGATGHIYGRLCDLGDLAQLTGACGSVASSGLSIVVHGGQTAAVASDGTFHVEGISGASAVVVHTTATNDPTWYGGAAWVVPDASGGAMNVQIPVIRQTAKEQLLTGSMANLAGGEGITVLHLHDNTGAALTTATVPVVSGETAYYDTGNAYTMTQGGAGTGPAGTAAYLGIAPNLAGFAVTVTHGTHLLMVETIAVGNALVVTHASLP